MNFLPADVERLVAALVRIDSVNPTLVPGGAGEAEVMRFASGWLRDAGLDVELVDAAPGRPSVIATARGRGGGRSLMLNGHLDTVGVEGMSEPFSARVSEGRLYGRGGYDMKGGVAAAMLAAVAAAREELAGDVVVTAVADEEHSSVGTQAVLERVGADACVVTEPTGLDVMVAHKGFAWWEVTAAGRAAHGSQPHLGVDAIAAIGPVLVGVAELERSLAARRHELLGPGSVHASLIAGGQELSSYPERCTLAIERRTLPGEGAEQLEAELARLVAAGDSRARLSGRTALVRAPFEVAPDEPIVALVHERATAVLGRDGGGAHAVEEWVELDSVRACADVLLATARAFCG